MVDGLHPPRKVRKNVHDENFARYYTDISRTKILNPAEERELFAEYARTGSRKARDKLIENCLRYVVTLAGRYANDIDQLKDLVSAGNEGALHALKRYDSTRGTRFISYANYWILLFIRNELHKQDLVAMPTWRQKTLRKVRQAKSRIAARGGDATCEFEICSEVNISTEQLDKLQIEQFYYQPFEGHHAPTNGTFKTVADNITKETLQRFIDNLSPKERFVIRGYFGLVTDPMSLGQIGGVLQITSERVRQIREGILGRFRKYLCKELGLPTPKQSQPSAAQVSLLD